MSNLHRRARSSARLLQRPVIQVLGRAVILGAAARLVGSPLRGPAPQSAWRPWSRLQRRCSPAATSSVTSTAGARRGATGRARDVQLQPSAKRCGLGALLVLRSERTLDNDLAFCCERQPQGHRMISGNQARGPHRIASRDVSMRAPARETEQHPPEHQTGARQQQRFVRRRLIDV